MTVDTLRLHEEALYVDVYHYLQLTPDTLHSMTRNEHKTLLVIKTFIFNDEGKFLTLLRAATAPTRPLTWDLPGGMYERGEDPELSARREIMEETGLEVTDLTLLGLKVKERLTDTDEPVVRVAYRAKTSTTLVTLSFEHGEAKWVSPEEFLELESTPSWKDFAREHLF